ncbi:MAG: hypothetical protein ACI4EN_09745 [Butyrivibrio sp.]
MLRKKLVTLGLATVMAIAALSGCKGQSGSTQEVTSETVRTTEPTTPEETTGEEATSKEEETSSQAETSPEVMGRVDAEDICKNISINGKLVEFPWTLNKLGEEYEFGYLSEGEDGNYGAYLQYDGKNIIPVVIKPEKDVDRNSTIYYISFNLISDISLYDFQKESTIENIVKKLGNPSKIKKNDISLSYIYETDEIYLLFDFSVDDNKLNNINIIYDLNS